MDKKARQSKTIWFHAITMILTIAGIWNVEFVKDFLDTPEKQVMAATLLQGVVGILLRYATSSGMKIPKIPGINSIFIAMLLCLPLIAVASCKSDDFKQIESIWSIAEPILEATTEVAADWCETGTVQTIIPAAAQACDDFVATKDDGLEAVVGVGRLVKGITGIAQYWTKDNAPTQAQRVRAIRNAYRRMPTSVQQDIALALQTNHGPNRFGPHIEVTNAGRQRLAADTR